MLNTAGNAISILYSDDKASDICRNTLNTGNATILMISEDTSFLFLKQTNK